MRRYKELKYSTEYSLGTMTVGDTIISEKEVQLMPIHVQSLNSQFENSGVKYELIEEKASKSSHELEAARKRYKEVTGEKAHHLLSIDKIEEKINAFNQ